MTRTQAIEIAHSLTIAVQEGMITREQATRRFRKVAAQYKRSELLKELQKVNEKLWVRIPDLLGA